MWNQIVDAVSGPLHSMTERGGIVTVVKPDGCAVMSCQEWFGIPQLADKVGYCIALADDADMTASRADVVTFSKRTVITDGTPKQLLCNACGNTKGFPTTFWVRGRVMSSRGGAIFDRH